MFALLLYRRQVGKAGAETERRAALRDPGTSTFFRPDQPLSAIHWNRKPTMDLEVHYTISMPVPEAHLFHVVVDVRGYTASEARFVLPIWAPGSYLIREFARHVEGFEAETADGESLPWLRADKASWVVTLQGVAAFRVRYQVYAFEWSVRSSHLTSQHGYFNGTSVFMYLDGYKQHPVSLEILPPPTRDWQVSIALLQDASGHYHAATYDQLVDSPAEIGRQRVTSFEVFGKSHELAIFGEGNEDVERLRADLKTIVETVGHLFDDELPYERYLFILHLSDGRSGGLEHRDSTTLLTDRWTFQPQSAYEKFLRLAAHEFFHVWNGKRVRAQNLGPFDYLHEVYTPLLWIVEGVTTYYDLLILRRAGLISPQRYLTLLGERIATYHSTPGRLVQTLEEASLAAWIKFYRPDENSPNSAISYYLKGSLVALMIDLGMRESTGNEKSLDDLMRYLWSRYGQRDVGFSPDEFADALDLVAEGDYEQFLGRYVRSTAELPLEEVLARAGLTLTYRRKEETPTVWMGLSLEEREGRLVVKTVHRGGPAEAGDLNPGDELLALNGYRLASMETLSARLNAAEPGQSATFHFFREGHLLSREVVLSVAPPDEAIIEQVTRPTLLQRAIYESWLQTSWTGNGDERPSLPDEPRTADDQQVFAGRRSFAVHSESGRGGPP